MHKTGFTNQVDLEKRGRIFEDPSVVMRVEVAVGDRVEAGQGVVIVEAMKMENELKAPAAGVVSRIDVAAGQTVEKGAVLLVLE